MFFLGFVQFVGTGPVCWNDLVYVSYIIMFDCKPEINKYLKCISFGTRRNVDRRVECIASISIYEPVR